MHTKSANSRFEVKFVDHYPVEDMTKQAAALASASVPTINTYCAKWTLRLGCFNLCLLLDDER